jgi:hypothetical protein
MLENRLLLFLAFFSLSYSNSSLLALDLLGRFNKLQRIIR